MNEQQNAALVRSLYDAFDRQDIQFIRDHLTDDVEWTLEGPAISRFLDFGNTATMVEAYTSASGASR
jgi:ketosteroid isomerase-like protein